HPILGNTSLSVLYLGGPAIVPLGAVSDAIFFAIAVILFILAWSNRRRALPIGIAVALVLGAIAAVVEAPIGPPLQQIVFGFGGIAACIIIFLSYDLLTTIVAIFSASTLLTLPLLSVAHGHAFTQIAFAIGLPLIVLSA